MELRKRCSEKDGDMYRLEMGVTHGVSWHGEPESANGGIAGTLTGLILENVSLVRVTSPAACSMTATLGVWALGLRSLSSDDLWWVLGRFAVADLFCNSSCSLFRSVVSVSIPSSPITVRLSEGGSFFTLSHRISASRAPFEWLMCWRTWLRACHRALAEPLASASRPDDTPQAWLCLSEVEIPNRPHQRFPSGDHRSFLRV